MVTLYVKGEEYAQLETPQQVRAWMDLFPQAYDYDERLVWYINHCEGDKCE